MPVYFIRHLGANFAIIEPIGAVDPGFGVGGGGVDPGYGHGGVRPDRPDQSLPGHRPPHIDNALPGAPGSPGNELPAGPPPHVPAGTVLVLVRDQAGVWHYATTAPGTPPPTTLPEPPGVGVWPKPRPPHPDQGLPMPPVVPGQLPGQTPQPKPA